MPIDAINDILVLSVTGRNNYNGIITDTVYDSFLTETKSKVDAVRPLYVS